VRRRTFLLAGGACLAGPLVLAGGSDVARVRLVQDRATGRVGFDPVGLRVPVGTVVRWVNGGGVHTVTAYHPDNGGRTLRIPDAAQPWDSGYLQGPGASFRLRLGVPGIYDYFCHPHETAGMVGRLLVGPPPPGGAAPFAAGSGRDPVPPEARSTLPSVAEIARRGAVPLAE
jgi:plastocyanin